MLIVDEEPLIQWCLRERLAQDGLAVLVADSGRSALDLLDEGAVDLVLLDLKLPDVSGLVVLEHITRRWPRTPVIMMTGYWASDEADRARALGVLQIVPKPFDLEVVARAVRRAVRSSPSETKAFRSADLS
ncbi:MAG: response regulator [Vicinamibacterales bacterium]